MPRFKVVVQKKFGTEYWVNDYYLTATDFAEADSLIQPVIDAEKALHLVGVKLDMYRISTVVPDDGLFVNFPINASCTHTDAGDMLPLFVVLRFDLGAVTGRAGRKYMRGVLSEGSITFEGVNPDHITQYDTLYAAPLRALDYLEKQSGVLLNDCVVNPLVGMRQLRRGSKRKTAPII